MEDRSNNIADKLGEGGEGGGSVALITELAS